MNWTHGYGGKPLVAHDIRGTLMYRWHDLTREQQMEANGYWKRYGFNDEFFPVRND